MLSKNKFTDYIIFDFLDDRSILSLMRINKTFHAQDAYFRHRLSKIYNLDITLSKPETLTYRKWWQLLIINRISMKQPNQILQFGIKNNFLTVVDYALTLKVDINSAFVVAAELNNMKIAKLLVNSGADIQYRYNLPLRKSARAGCFNIVRFLVKRGADIREFGDEALKSAILSGNSKLVNYLIRRGSTLTFSMLELLVDLKKKDILTHYMMSLSSKMLEQLIRYAIGMNILDMVEFMLDRAPKKKYKRSSSPKFRSFASSTLIW